MFTFFLWAAIILCLVLAARRIARGAAVFLVFIAMLFFAVFMLDSVTTFPIREYMTLGWYDETLKDPVGTVEELGKETIDKGVKVADAITNTGKRLDVKYGDEKSKEWVLLDEDVEEEAEEENEDTEKSEHTQEPKQEKPKRVVVEQDVGKDKKKLKEEKEKVIKEESVFVSYKEVNTALNNELKNLVEQDKEIIRGMTSIYRTKIEGLGMEVWNNGDEGDEGMYVKVHAYD